MTALKISQFTIRLDDCPSVGKHTLYNTLSRATVTVNDQGLRLLEGLPHVPRHPKALKWLQALEQNGLLVPIERDEGEWYLQRREAAKADTSAMHVTLSLIQDCNFGCGYCYQQGKENTHNKQKITNEGQQDSVQTTEIIRFLKAECKARGVKRLHFTAYGGEPLLNKAALLEIVQPMRLYTAEHGIKWAFDMVSNGSLLNRKTVLELKRYGFVKVQVTIDGNKETHDASRPFKGANDLDISTYEVIMRNLENWAGLIHTDVLCVVSESNIAAAHELIETLAEKGLAEKGVRVMFSPISPTYDEMTIEETAQRAATDPSHSEQELALIDAITTLEIHAAQRGLIDDLRPTETFCSVIRANGQNVTITPDGKIYSCALFLGRDEKYATGHIEKQGPRSGLDTLMKTFAYPEQCKRCAYLPICSNCRADALSATGEIHGANSYKERYERMLPKLIEAHVKGLTNFD